MPPFDPEFMEFYRAPVLLPTRMLIGEELEPVMPAPVGVAAAVNATAPRFEGLHEHVAVKLDEDPVANLFLHPGKTLPFILKVIFDATVTVAVMTTGERKVAVVAAPAN